MLLNLKITVSSSKGGEKHRLNYGFPINNNVQVSNEIGNNNFKFVANSACDLPSISALIKYHYASAGFLVKATWCQVIKNGNYATWPELTEELAQHYCSNSEEIFLVP